MLPFHQCSGMTQLQNDALLSSSSISPITLSMLLITQVFDDYLALLHIRQFMNADKERYPTMISEKCNISRHQEMACFLVIRFGYSV